MSVSPSICPKYFFGPRCVFIPFTKYCIHTYAQTSTHTCTIHSCKYELLLFFFLWVFGRRSLLAGAVRPPWSRLSFYHLLCRRLLLCHFILLAKQLCGTSCLCFLCGFLCVHFVLMRTVNQRYKQVIYITTVCCVFNVDGGDCNSLPAAASSSSSVNLIALSSCLHSVKFLAFHLLPYEESVSGRHTIFGAAGAT